MVSRATSQPGRIENAATTPHINLMTELTKTPHLDAETRDQIAALALRQRRANGVLMKAVNMVGGQVEDTLKKLPQGARDQIDAAARKALLASYDAASRSRSNYGGSDAVHKAMSAVSGALGGLGGLPTALVELPVATTVIFRAVQTVAEHHGEDPLSAETRAQCLAVFGSGGPGTDDDGIDTSFFGSRLALTGAAVQGLIGKVAPRFATVLSQKLASQAVPILGAAAGAGTNYAFTEYYVSMAHVHFGLRALARDHDEARVLEEFHRVLAARDVPVKRA